MVAKIALFFRFVSINAESLVKHQKNRFKNADLVAKKSIFG